MANNEYSSAQLRDMQQDAVKRVNEMWRQSQQKISETQNVFSGTEKREEKKSQPHIPQKENSDCDIHKSDNENNPQEYNPLSPFTGIIQRMGLDDETIILLMMLLLLVNEGADVKLIMALVYILI